MGGWKTVILSVATMLLGLLESQGVSTYVAQHPGGVVTGIGFAILVLRWMTTSPIFSKE